MNLFGGTARPIREVEIVRTNSIPPEVRYAQKDPLLHNTDQKIADAVQYLTLTNSTTSAGLC